MPLNINIYKDLIFNLMLSEENKLKINIFVNKINGYIKVYIITYIKKCEYAFCNALMNIITYIADRMHLAGKSTYCNSVLHVVAQAPVDVWDCFCLDHILLLL